MTPSTIKKCSLLLFLGGFQGFLGWYMVKSGLVDRPDVSHYRLALHLVTAFITFAYALWVALDIWYPTKKEIQKKFRNLIRWGLIVLLLQIIWGAFVAGLDAGWIHNHWPLMSDGEWMHESVTIEQDPVWKNFVEGKSGVQFMHRYLAYVVVAIIALIWYRSKKMILLRGQKNGIQLLLGLTLIQFVLGVFTLILNVPVWLGVMHQVAAFLLLSAMTFTLHRFSR